MGIRIHKKLGYGFSDIVKHDVRFTPRYLNTIGRFDYQKLEDIFEEDDGSFLKHLERMTKNKDIIFADFYHDLYQFKKTKTKAIIDFYKFITYDDEYGLPNVFLMQPVFGHNDWSRYDNTLDYYDHSNVSSRQHPQEDTVKTMRWTNIYPYSNWIDIQTNEKFGSDIFSAIQAINHLIEIGKDPDTYFSQNFSEVTDTNILAESTLGKYNTFREFENNVFPLVPESIVEFCNYFEIFKKKNTVNTLIPMIYTYWA